jgi:hypothetical protein
MGMATAAKDRAALFRERAKELRSMAERISPSMRQDLFQVAVEWERLAAVAERDNDDDRLRDTSAGDGVEFGD